MIAEQKELSKCYTIPTLIILGLVGGCICKNRGYVL